MGARRVSSFLGCGGLLLLTASGGAGELRPVVAVFQIEARSLKLERGLLESLTEYLAVAVAEEGVYTIVPPGDIKRALVERKRVSYQECYDQSCQIELGRELAASKSLATSLLRIGDACVVTAVLYDLGRQASDATAKVEGGCRPKELMRSLAEVAARIRKAGPAAPAQAAPPVAAPPPGLTAPAGYSLARAELRRAVLEKIDKEYHLPEDVRPDELLAAALASLAGALPGLQVDQAGGARRLAAAGREHSLARPVADLGALARALDAALLFVEPLATGPDQALALEAAALRGLLARLGGANALLTPRQVEEIRVSTQGAFGGLGMQVQLKEGHLLVVAPLEGTPAWRAGVRSGWRILAIDGQPVEGLALEQAVALLRGAPGSRVEVEFALPGGASRREVLTREVIRIQAVEGRLLAGGVGYARIRSFQKGTRDELAQALARLGPGVGLVVLDLRGCPGGLMAEAVEVADHFLAQGEIVAIQTRRERQAQVAKAGPGDLLEVPLAVLVDRGTASSAELVAAALGGLGRALVLGEPTFAKGTVEVLYDLPHGFQLKLSMAQYVAAGSRYLHGRGVPLDVRAEALAEGEAADASAIRYRPGPPGEPGRDPLVELARRLFAGCGVIKPDRCLARSSALLDSLRGTVLEPPVP
jgi:carboxyl-terminal processing protease